MYVVDSLFNNFRYGHTRLHPVQVSMQRNGDKGEWVLAELSLVRLSSHLSCIHSSFDFFTECEQRVAKLGVLGKFSENHCKQCKYNIYKYIYISRTLPINWQAGLAVRVDNDMHWFSDPRYTPLRHLYNSNFVIHSQANKSLVKRKSYI